MVRSFVRFFTPLLFGIIVAGSSAPLHANAENPEKEPLKLVTGPLYPPFAAEYLPGYGLAPFLISRILESGGRTVTVDLLPWNRAYRNSLAGEYDAVLPYIESQARRDDFIFSLPVFELDAFVYVKSDSGIYGESPSVLNGLSYCNPVGFSDGRVLERLSSEGKIKRVTAANLIFCFRMLLAGRVDFVKINEQVAGYILDRLARPSDSIRRLPFVIEHTSLHLMVPRTRPGADALIEEFDALFREMKHSGQIESLESMYLDQLIPGQ